MAGHFPLVQQRNSNPDECFLAYFESGIKCSDNEALKEVITKRRS
jgi:hypothetical protein